MARTVDDGSDEMVSVPPPNRKTTVEDVVDEKEQPSKTQSLNLENKITTVEVVVDEEEQPSKIQSQKKIHEKMAPTPSSQPAIRNEIVRSEIYAILTDDTEKPNHKRFLTKSCWNLPPSQSENLRSFRCSGSMSSSSGSSIGKSRNEDVDGDVDDIGSVVEVDIEECQKEVMISTKEDNNVEQSLKRIFIFVAIIIIPLLVILVGLFTKAIPVSMIVRLD